MEVLKLNALRFHAYHGCLEQEKAVGNDYELYLTLKADLSRACQSDCLDDTINYAEVHSLVAREMQTPSKLIEHVAWRIARSLLQSYPALAEATVYLKKMHPPIAGQVESAGIEVTIKRNDGEIR